jgi:hypothetical protein
MDFPDTTLSLQVKFCSFCSNNRVLLEVVSRYHYPYSDFIQKYTEHEGFRCPRPCPDTWKPEHLDHLSVCRRCQETHPGFTSSQPFHDPSDTCPLCVPDSLDAQIVRLVQNAPANSVLADMYDEDMLGDNCLWICDRGCLGGVKDRVLIWSWFRYWSACTRTHGRECGFPAWYYLDEHGMPCTLMHGNGGTLFDGFVPGAHVCPSSPTWSAEAICL